MSRILKALAILAVPMMISMATNTPHAASAQGSVKAGFLSCEVAGGVSVSFIFGSSRDLTCTFETSDTRSKNTPAKSGNTASTSVI